MDRRIQIVDQRRADGGLREHELHRRPRRLRVAPDDVKKRQDRRGPPLIASPNVVENSIEIAMAWSQRVTNPRICRPSFGTPLAAYASMYS